MTIHPRFIRLSLLLKHVITLSLILLPTLFAALWWQFDWLAANAPELNRLAVDAQSVGPGRRVLGFLISMLPVSLLLYGLWRLREAFERFSQGEFFTYETITCIRSFALMVMLQSLMRPVATTLLSVLLTMSNPPGQRTLAISIGSGELEMLFVGAVFFAVAHLMVEGRRLADDNAQII